MEKLKNRFEDAVPSVKSRPRAASKTVSIALQGGGSHGAFTWGVLDRLLEDGRISIDGLSGASAGAINAAVLAHGYTVGGRDGARESLKVFWESICGVEAFQFIASQMSHAFVRLSRHFSPYQLNPLNLNPLRNMLAAQIDFERLRADCRLNIFIAATEVDTGMLRLFQNAELTLEVLLASSCLPQFHHSVEIDGVAYWDGGLTANPPIRPLLYKCDAEDIVLLLLNPRRRKHVPSTAEGIGERLTEISFSSALFAELQGIALAKQEAENGMLLSGSLERRLKRLKMHVIESPELMERLEPLSRLDTHASFIKALFEEGRASAGGWLARHYEAIGLRSSFPLGDHLI
jgi:NTE family protein